MLIQHTEQDQGKKSTKTLEFSSTKWIFLQEAVFSPEYSYEELYCWASTPQHIFTLFSKVLLKFLLVYLKPYRFQFYLKAVTSPTHNNDFRLLPYGSLWWLFISSILHQALPLWPLHSSYQDQHQPINLLSADTTRAAASTLGFKS